MGDRAGRAAWGAGRVAFLARLETISREMREGHSLTTIFERHRLAADRARAAAELKQRHLDHARRLAAFHRKRYRRRIGTMGSERLFARDHRADLSRVPGFALRIGEVDAIVG